MIHFSPGQNVARASWRRDTETKWYIVLCRPSGVRLPPGTSSATGRSANIEVVGGSPSFSVYHLGALQHGERHPLSVGVFADDENLDETKMAE